MSTFDLIVIGAGAAGCFGAISALEENPRLKVLILEKQEEPLRKVMLTGGGRCNFSHACYDPRELIKYYPRGNKELLGPFTRFQPRDMVLWLKGKQISVKKESDGRMFPVSDDAATIVDVLLKTLNKFHVEIKCSSEVIRICKDKDTDFFSVSLKNGRTTSAHSLFYTPGGGGKANYAFLSNLGISIIPPVPSLFSLKLAEKELRKLAGISVQDVKVRLDNDNKRKKKDERKNLRGPLLITHQGISGPAILALSAWEARALAENQYQAILEINWAPALQKEDLEGIFSSMKAQSFKKHFTQAPPTFPFPTKLWHFWIERAGIPEDKVWADISKKEFEVLTQEILTGKFQINGRSKNKDEFVTAGGIDLKEVNFKTMQVKKTPGLYAAGEVLNMDGLTGGFNLQAAWTTGWIAGRAIAENHR
ncbi:MAG: NAD(P)/FAD-dependent oxidoreductase [Anaerolineales bacterium]|nr:NAD(P)/FAD-dependent oxidoreductase [Anaerolineales bacterium]